ncbi:MAG: amidohydrolase family protein, partial [Myxococcales bacterium]|nr:amidohydrolase family protein [Myxococcales bacterium]
CYGATERNGGRDEAQRGLAECRRFLLSNRRPHVRGAVALHASFTVSDATVLDAAHLCRDLGALMHVHLAEDAADVADARERGYPGPLERLLALEALPPGSICAHGVHLSAEQVARATRDGLWLVQNPRSNEGNRVGYGASLGADPRVALGTDGYPARMDDEAQALARLGAEHGAPADVVARRLAASRALARTIFGDGVDEDTVERDASGAVMRVVVGGRAVVEDGRLTGGDIDAIRADAAREAEALWGRMRAL